MTKHNGLVLLALVGCGTPDGALGPDRGRVAKAALTVEANEVSCSSPAGRAFSAGVCVCEDVELVGEGLSAISAERTPVEVGVNGYSRVVGEWKIHGGLVSWKGIENVGRLTVSGDVMTPQDVSGVGSLDVGGDLIVGGRLTTVGQLKVGGLLRAQGEVTSLGTGLGMPRGDYLPRDSAPCGCEASQLIDIAKAVEQARTSNDNASIGLDPKVRSVGELTLELKGGRYFIDNLQTVGSLKLRVTRPSALYVSGDWQTVGRDDIEVEAGAALDLYVAGNIENVGEWNVGDSTLAGVVRLFVGGARSELSSVGSADIVGALYAPQADLQLVGDTTFRGAVFAKSLRGTGKLLVDYAKPAEPAPGSCSK